MRKGLHILCLIFLMHATLLAQQQEVDPEHYVQYSGKIVQFETGEPIHGVRVTNLNKDLVTLTNKKGVFTIVASRRDKIQFSHLGMEHVYSIIPEDADSKVYEEKALAISSKDIEAVVITDLPPLDELADRLMAMDIPDSRDRQLALQNPDIFNILDTIIAHEPALVAFKNGKVESSPISWFYEKVYKKIKERIPKPNRLKEIPEYKPEEDIEN